MQINPRILNTEKPVSNKLENAIINPRILNTEKPVSNKLENANKP